MRPLVPSCAFAASTFVPGCSITRPAQNKSSPASSSPQTPPVCRSSPRRSRKGGPGSAGAKARKASKGATITPQRFKRFEPRVPQHVGPNLPGTGGRNGSPFSLDNCPCLVLNADFQPLSYIPLSLWPWQETIKAVYSNRVTVVATYDVSVRSPSMIFQLPSVICLKKYQRTDHKPPFTRFNVFLRDNFSCQYCGIVLRTQDLTFDHVVPRCAGGKTNWTNVVTACTKCNHAKGRKMVGDLHDMVLAKIPVAPTNAQLQNAARNFPPRQLHESWVDYLYWNESMQVD